MKPVHEFDSVADAFGVQGAYYIKSPSGESRVIAVNRDSEARDFMRDWAKHHGEAGYYEMFRIGSAEFGICLKEAVE